MKTWKHLLLLLLLVNFSCEEQKTYQSESSGDIAISGQKMIDVLLTPDKINGIFFITSRENDPITNLRGNSKYENLIGVSHTKEVTGDLHITNNKELADLSPLDSLIVIGHSIMIKNNPKISNLDFIKSIKAFGGIELKQISISNLDFLEDVEVLDRYLGLHELDSLKDFSTLKLQKVKGIFLDSLQHMTNTDFLSNLEQITDAIYITKNPNLTHIKLNLKNTTLKQRIRISSNNQLTSIEGLEQLQQIDKDIIIADNDSLTDLNFLKSIKEINGRLSIRGNKNLVDFSGLSNIESVKGSILIEDNGQIDSEVSSQIRQWKKKWSS